MDEIMKYIEMIYQTPASMIDTALGHIARSPSMYVGKYGQMSTDEAVTKQDFANMPVERGSHVYRDEYGDVEEIMLYYNIYLDDCYYGRLVLICDEEWKLTYLKDVLESLGPAVEKLCNRLIPSGDGSFYSPEFMFQMDRFLVGDGEPDFDLLAGCGWLRYHHYVVIILKQDIHYPLKFGPGFHKQKMVDMFRDIYMSQIDGCPLGIINLDLCPLDAFSRQQKLVYFLREYVCKAGISNVFTDLSLLPLYIRQAKDAIRLGEKRDEMFWYYRFGNYSYESILEKSTADYPVEDMIHPALKLLLKRDEEKESDLFHTLKVYLKLKCNGLGTARELNIHRTTFLYRMKLIQEITGINPDHPDLYAWLLVSYDLYDRNQIK